MGEGVGILNGIPNTVKPHRPFIIRMPTVQNSTRNVIWFSLPNQLPSDVLLQYHDPQPLAILLKKYRDHCSKHLEDIKSGKLNKSFAHLSDVS